MTYGPLPVVAPRRVVVTGIGMVTPLGLCSADTWSAVCAGSSGVRPLQQAPYFVPDYITKDKSIPAAAKEAAHAALVEAMPCKVAASIPPIQERGGKAGDVFAPTAHLPRSFRFCEAAVAEALHDADLLDSATTVEVDPVVGSGERSAVSPACLRFHGRLRLSEAEKERFGVNIGMGIPSLADVTDVAAHLFHDAVPRGDAPPVVRYNKIHPHFVPKILGNMAAGHMAIAYGLQGPIGSCVAACATGAHCIGEAASWIRAGTANQMLCGATEACITPISIGGFSRMKALCTRYPEGHPEAASRPFDVDRGGFVMGEGCGILLLEELEHALRRGAPRIYGELRGFGVASDAHHVAAPHPAGRGATRCVRAALQDGGGVQPQDIAYVNAHATGTMGDEIELLALHQSLRSGPAAGRPLWVSSAKGGLGHLLGAAGSVEAGLAVKALATQTAPPTANLASDCVTAAQREAGLLCPTTCVKLEGCRATLSTSFGFGGINTSLLFTDIS